MKAFRFIICAALGFLSFSLQASAQIDSTKLKELDSRLEAYFGTLEMENIEVKEKECDYLVETTSDSVLRQHIALKVYSHYLNSPVMGDEAVAIHFTDTWFASGKVKMVSDIDLMNARIFADFNRQSLLGLEAPRLELDAPDGSTVAFGGPSSRFRVLFFYDTECPKCKLETVMLRGLLDKKDYPVDFYAVYTGQNADSWKTWRESKFVLKAEDVRVFHLWDPDVSSDYQMKYGVIQTPRMFLIDRRGVIIGRGMDSEALQQLLDMLLADENYDYGNEKSMALMDKLMSAYGDTVKARNIVETADLIGRRTLDKGDTLFFKHLEGDYLYWLSSKRGEVWSEGTESFIRKYILDRKDIWNSEYDTLMVVGMARMMDELFSRTPVGTKLPKEKISGWNRLRRKGGYILFHTEGCKLCEAEIAAADSMKARHLDVNMDELQSSSPETAKILMDTFDLSVLPYVIQVGRGGVIRRKYVSLVN